MRASRMLQSLVVWLVLLSPVAALAQNKFEFGPFGGGSFFSNAFFKTSTPTPETGVGYNFVNGGVFGVRARENLTEHFGLEQSYAFLGNNNAQFPQGLFGTRFRQFYFNGNLIGYDNESRVRPYFSGGVGVSMFRPTDDALNQATLMRTPIGNSNEFHYQPRRRLEVQSHRTISGWTSVCGTSSTNHPRSTGRPSRNRTGFTIFSSKEDCCSCLAVLLRPSCIRSMQEMPSRPATRRCVRGRPRPCGFLRPTRFPQRS